MNNATDFLINRSDLSDTRFATSQANAEALDPGQARLRIESFALTANNITYAVLGEQVAYWRFFPTEEGWGKLPVWGFARVEASATEGVPVGKRVYGYFPLATHLTVEPGTITDKSFIDAAAHRSQLPLIYNQYHWVPGEAEPTQEALRALLQPLFTTAYLIADEFRDEQGFGAQQVLLSSASSKTALATAFMLQRNRTSADDYRVVGLTSTANRPFVEATGVYDEVLGYDQIAALPADSATAYIDFSGDRSLREQLHHHVKEQMLHSSQIGLTHWSQGGASQALPGAKPVVFFAPSQYQKAIKKDGASQLNRQMAEAMHAFHTVAQQIEVVFESGQEAVSRVYQALLKGDASPAQGHVLTL